MPRLIPLPSRDELIEDTEGPSAGVLRRKAIPDGLRQQFGRRYGGGYRERTVATAEGEVKEVYALAAGGSASNNTTPRGAELEAAKPVGEDRNRILEKCYELFVSDPLGGQIAETTRNFIFGTGTKATFEDDAAQAWVNRFRSRNMVNEKEKCMGAMSVYQGDIYLWLRPVMEDMVAGRRRIEIAGDTRLTMPDPLNITGVNHDPTDPQNVYFYVHEYKDPDKGGAVKTTKIPDHAYYDPDKDSGVGCIIHIKFNADPNDAFGNPDYLRVGEWLENYKEYLRDGVIINKLYRSPCYDIKIIDGDEGDVQAAIARYRNWKIGSNPVHNDKEEWDVLEFTGPNSSQSEARRAILLIIAAGVGFAEYMLADGSNANLASTTTQELPVLKKFEARQGTFKTFFGIMYQIVLMNAAVHGDLAENFDEFDADYFWEGTVEFPPLTPSEEKDTQDVNEGAVEMGIMSERTAAGRLGLNLDDELRKMAEDAEAIAEAQKLVAEALSKAGLPNSIDTMQTQREELDVAKAGASGGGNDNGDGGGSGGDE